MKPLVSVGKLVYEKECVFDLQWSPKVTVKNDGAAIVFPFMPAAPPAYTYTMPYLPAWAASMLEQPATQASGEMAAAESQEVLETCVRSKLSDGYACPVLTASQVTAAEGEEESEDDSNQDLNFSRSHADRGAKLRSIRGKTLPEHMTQLPWLRRCRRLDSRRWRR